MTSPERIETARLLLRKPRHEDAAAIFDRYAGHPEVTKYLSWPTHQSLADTELFLAFSDAEWQRWPAGPLLIEARGSGQLLGSTGLAFETRTEASTGYVLAKDAWGKGYATEALTAVNEFADGLGVGRLHACCHPAHQSSIRVLEKCGFVRDTVLSKHASFPNLGSSEPQDCLRYVRLHRSSPTLKIP